MKDNNQNLEHLLRQFVDNAEAEHMADDIRQADRLFDNYQAPSVQPETIAAVQLNVRRQLKHTRHMHRRRQWIGIAAVVAIFLIGLFVLNAPDATTTSRQATFTTFKATEWGLNSNLHVMDQSLAEIENELGSLAETIEALDTGTYEPVNPLRLELIQLEEIEAMTSTTEFWKG